MFWSKLTLSRKTIVPALVICIVVPAVLINVSSHSKPSSPQAQGKRDQALEVEVVTITPDGFEPQQIERSAGPFLLSVNNRSGIDSLNVLIETEQRGRFREKSLPLVTPYWREVINPPPGKYVITEASHPEWTLTIIIQ